MRGSHHRCPPLRPTAEPHRQNGEQLLDAQLRLQPLFKHADGLVLQVVIGGDPAIRQGLDGALVLEGKQKDTFVQPQTPSGTRPAELQTSWTSMQ